MGNLAFPRLLLCTSPALGLGLLLQVELVRVLAREGQPQVRIGQAGDAPPPGGAGEEANLHEVGFVHVLQGHGLLADGGGQGLQAHQDRRRSSR